MEWTFHKTADDSHPNGHEQQIMWLMNRARTNPTQEGLWLASSTDEDIAGGRDYFNVDINMLKNEFVALDVKPPAAFDKRLYEAAYTHSLDLINRDAQDHNNQFVRITNAGFQYWAARGSVFSYAKSGLNAHAAWNIDWGGSEGGMQVGRGHRMATMSADGNYTNVGVAAIYENSAKSVGPYVTTGNYCYASESAMNHFNIFIVGTVWHDTNGNSQYDPGEGKANVLVTPDQGSYYAVTGNSGGYAIPVDPGTNYRVTFSGNSLPGSYIKSVSVAQKSALLDIETSVDTPIGRKNVPLPGILMLLL